MAVVTISRSVTSLLSSPLEINLSIGGTAIYGVDYTVTGADVFSLSSAVVIIPANLLEVNLILNTIPNTVTESNRTVIINLINPLNTTVNNSSVTWAIIDDDVAIVNTVLLLHFDEDGFIDSSPNPVEFFSPTFSYLRPDAKFGVGNFHTWDGSMKIGYAPKLANLLTGDMCIELWVSNKIFEYFSEAYIFSVPTCFIFKIVSHRNFEFQFLDGLGSFLTARTTLTSVPIHVALTKENDTYRIFFNGILQSTAIKANPPIDRFDPNSDRYKIGQHYNVTNGLFFDELRITRNDAVYTSNFTPPIAAFTIT